MTRSAEKRPPALDALRIGHTRGRVAFLLYTRASGPFCAVNENHKCICASYVFERARIPGSLSLSRSNLLGISMYSAGHQLSGAS